jgi:Prophage minor tail protein Z (GPZ)
VQIDINTAGMDTLVRRFKALPKQAERAEKRAISKTTTKARSELVKDVARQNDITQKVIRQFRSVRKISRSRLTGIAWLGYKPIKASYVGRPRQTKRGARVRRFFFEGAFVATMPTGHVGVFKRKGKERLPIAEQVIELQQVAGSAAAVRDRMGDEFIKRFRQELNFEVNVKGKR